uniref:PrgI family protein n=1 Tax=Dysosmobacter sp. TaxID=2591382 RepID=UPI003AB6CD05
MAYVTVPKDLTKIKSKMLFGLTKRQLVCFGSAALVGVPLFFLSKGSMGTTPAALCMILVMLPFFLFALYEKNGQTPEALLGNLIQCKFTRPKKRVYQTNNAYSALEKQAELERTVGRIASGAGKRGKGRRRLTRQERKQIEAVIRQAKGDGKNHTVQASLPFRNMHPDGLCRLDDRHFSKTIAYADVSYRLAGPDDQRDIFERLCDFYNGYDPSIGVQMTLSSSHKAGGGDLFRMAAQGDELDGIRAEASGILQTQYERGSNGYVKSKYVTLTIEAESIQAARARFSRIEADTLNRFKVMGAAAKVLDGKERLALLHGLLHPRGELFAFEWDWLAPSGLSVKDFIAPSSFEFGQTRRFRMGEMYGAVSFLQILAPEIQDRILTDFMDVEGNLLVTMHVRGINQNEAIKMVKRKITDLDAMKIQEQKKAARSGYDLDI